MAEKVLMKGNEAIAEAAIMAGCRHFFGYPITPQTEVAAYMAKRMPKMGGTYLQAESEIAAINMVYGASSAGVRAMTSSSSPGISLKSEGLSYMAGSDLPAVLVNIQRGGPGLGGIRPSQSDYFQATRSSGHGDFHMIVLAPNNVQEMFDLTVEAFELADQYRMTAMILGDGMLGQVMEPVDISRGEAASNVTKDWALTGTKGQRKRNVINSLYLEAEELEMLNLKRFEKYADVEKIARTDNYLTEDAEVIIVAYGICARIARNAINEARKKGIKAGLIRPVTLWPFPKNQLKTAAEKAKAFVVVEMSMGQMIQDVELSIRCSRPVHLCSRTGGMVPTPEAVLEAIENAAQAERS
ncbi:MULTISPECIES: 3-methyl-2-oxobutanoate dehydrogenase subunit VorB [Dehalobacter]|jgi:2-oxoglutarate ferredoxin oxidoreductase subunit alpha|uniref:3-methyl-2-oxobutanoate dehydrogenase subunit VorB n=2 Tax=Dehalobacter restrictus TaxID=55583 RepID=A0A857DJL7_9FIRM|nr:MULTISPECIES: 3-methyl-2-oxobutanoate dehydrogenase subunit VorB [Dehalobacter]AHF10209.1 2-ketoisovalerate ferredoxin reductase [Dehalobacter restrictus DSM 9455]MCG1025676.1 3-methyl-2-oxobutanoate dehydrogenase subunit VorB [Dehalobacter sp.]MDJ0306235.1 3-methyl-2-oxobutanoate dehydrogenase subunit VorB [Dehalobacter sp.]QHA00798.1 3-methyl-2-oxobutanoate dehydrogenase subunit VorB [Dehalobacter restrictus]